jgi:hypothetical protein
MTVRYRQSNFEIISAGPASGSTTDHRNIRVLRILAASFVARCTNYAAEYVSYVL